MATMPGNGMTSPFGDGAGKVRSDQMAQGDGKPDPMYTQSRPQQRGTAYDINTGDQAPGGQSVFADLDKRSPDPGNPVGTTAGEGRKPYKLTQG